MKRTPVASSNIVSIGYDGDKHVLEVEFRGGTIYQYFDISEKIYGEMFSSESMGAYFATHIKNKHAYNQIAGNFASIILNSPDVKSVGIEKALGGAIEEFSQKMLSSEDVALPSQKEVAVALREAYLSKSLTIVLGAGASIDYGLPSWNTLLQALLAQTFQGNGDDKDKALLFAEVFNGAFEPSPLIAARYLAGQFSKKDLGFEKEIRTLLYKNIKTDYTSNLMRELVQLIVAPGYSSTLDSIITYNYDDALEEEIRKSAVDVLFRSIFTVGQNPKKGELPIFHVHGFMPREGELTHDNQITLGEDLYHQQYTDVYSWANLVQLAKYKSSHCLFVGTSFTDPNQRRLLDIANDQRGGDPLRHFVIRKRYDVATIEIRLKRHLESSEEVFTQKVMQNIKLTELVKDMTDAIHRFDEVDAFSLGVQSLWVDQYSEVPTVLKNMRTG